MQGYKRIGHSAWNQRQNIVVFSLGFGAALLVIGSIQWLQSQQTPLQPQSSTITIPWIPSTVKRWSGPIDEMAKRYDIDPNVLAIIMTLESGGYTKANSGVASGLMQITDPTAKEIASKFLKMPITKYDLTDPRTSVEFGAAYLAHLRSIFADDSQGPSWDYTVELIAAGYNGGPGAANSVYKGEGLSDTQTVVYSRDAFNMWRERHASDSPTFDRWKERGGSSLLDAAKSEKI
jgi:soluble lytic murein transglycosylase-like protein